MFASSPRLMALVSVLAAFLMTACGDAESNPDQSEFAFGEPADAATATRTIEVATTDALAFEPAEITVTAGETITFRVVNNGEIIHDFTLGDEATQQEHEEEMREMAGMAHDQPNTVTIAAGETKELTWAFTEPGTVLIGCHQPGHYDAGMKGQITVGS